MRILKNLSIKNKIIFLILSITSFVLVAGFSIIIKRSVEGFEDDLVNNAKLSTKLIAEYSIYPLIFNDVKGANEIILKSDNLPWISSIVIYDADLQEFAAYHKFESWHYQNQLELSEKTEFIDDFIILHHPVVYKNKTQGLILVKISRDQLSAKINHFLLMMTVLGLILFSISIFLATRLQNLISKPILKLAEVAKNVGENEDYSLRVKKQGDDEIGVLYDGFNQMLEKIYNKKVEKNSALNALRESEGKIRAVFNQTFQFIALADLSGRIIDCNYLAINEFLNRDEELLQNNFSELSLWKNSETFRTKLKDFISEAASGKFMRFDAYLTNKNNEQKYFDFTIKPVKNKFSSINMLIIEGRDISKRKEAEKEIIRLNEELEERVEKRTMQLEATNKELEAFSYSVSHDLRAPLRSINGFSNAVLEDYSNVLDETGIDYLNRVVNASQNMAGLIDDLLNLSRITKSKINREEINISDISHEFIERHKEYHNGRSILYEIEQDIKVNADERLVRIVIDNLISNAWKFSSKNDEAMIKIYKIQKDEEAAPIICVEDNGAGFSMDYAEKMFGAFQRLHSDEEFEGTGIGLATVQRIINKHGGKIWAEGEINKGAKFQFTFE